MHGSPAIIRLCHYIVYFNHFNNHIEKIIREQLWDFLTQYNALNPHQHDFTKQKSCFANLLECHTNWTEALDDRHSVDRIYLDYSKAFDSVPHLRFINKFQTYIWHTGKPTKVY